MYYLPTMDMPPRTFRDFWPYYLMAHRVPACRRLHYIGTSGALTGIIAAFVLFNPLWLFVGLIFAYAMAWAGHFFVEHNRPATFGNPLWSLLGDVRMYFLWMTGQLQPALADAEQRIAIRD